MYSLCEIIHIHVIKTLLEHYGWQVGKTDSYYDAQTETLTIEVTAKPPQGLDFILVDIKL